MGSLTISSILAAGAIAAQIAMFFAISLASMRHFTPGRDSNGMRLIRVLSFGATVGLTILTIWLGGPVPVFAIAAVALTGLAWRILSLALQASKPGTLHVAFTGDGPDELITSGIYARIRNPLYLAYLLYWAAWIPIAGFHWASVLVFVWFGVLYTLAVLQEEAFLTRHHGISYQMYQANTGRFLPRLFE